MKKLAKLGVVSGLLVSSGSFAFNPVDGFYAGILAGVSHGPSSDHARYVDPNNIPFRGTVGYDVVGGGGGVTLGYKISHFRLEGEILYNRISTGPFKLDTDCTLQNAGVFSPTFPVYPPGTCIAPPNPHGAEAFGLAYKGSSNATYALVNLYYNLFADNEHQTVPYLGIGLGGVRISNNNNFPYTRTSIPGLLAETQRYDVKANGMAYQGIVGVSYYMDDLTWIGMDYRFTSTGKLRTMDDRTYILNAIMFNVNFLFDKGAINC